MPTVYSAWANDKAVCPPTGLQSFNVFVGCADARRRINRDRCASRCSEHPIYNFDITSEDFAEKTRVFNDNLESLFSQSRGVEMDINKLLAESKYER